MKKKKNVIDRKVLSKASGNNRKKSVKQPAIRTSKGQAKSQEKSVSSGTWTFLTNHAHVLIAIKANPDLVTREVSLKVGITERMVQIILQDLVESGYIKREKIGRKNRYEILTKKPLRHPLEEHKSIGDLLDLITKDR